MNRFAVIVFAGLKTREVVLYRLEKFERLIEEKISDKRVLLNAKIISRKSLWSKQKIENMINRLVLECANRNIYDFRSEMCYEFMLAGENFVEGFKRAYRDIISSMNGEVYDLYWDLVRINDNNITKKSIFITTFKEINWNDKIEN